MQQNAILCLSNQLEYDGFLLFSGFQRMCNRWGLIICLPAFIKESLKEVREKWPFWCTLLLQNVLAIKALCFFFFISYKCCFKSISELIHVY